MPPSPVPQPQETFSLCPAKPGVALTEDAGELGRAGHEVLEVHPQTAVAVAAGEGLGQLVVQMEACGEAAPVSPPKPWGAANTTRLRSPLFCRWPGFKSQLVATGSTLHF